MPVGMTEIAKNNKTTLAVIREPMVLFLNCRQSCRVLLTSKPSNISEPIILISSKVENRLLNCDEDCVA